jgi:disulfide bond formation protein DsbB
LGNCFFFQDTAMLARQPHLIAVALAFLIGLGTILAAWGYQVIGGYVPCKLCLMERWAYYAGLPLLLVAYFLGIGMPGFSRILAALAGLIFLAGTALAVHHAGAEWAFWPGPNDCGGGVATTTNAADLMSQLQNTRVVSCTEVSWRLYGLSFAGWNAVISLAVSFLAFRAAAGHVRTPSR